MGAHHLWAVRYQRVSPVICFRKWSKAGDAFLIESHMRDSLHLPSAWQKQPLYRLLLGPLHPNATTEGPQQGGSEPRTHRTIPRAPQQVLSHLLQGHGVAEGDKHWKSSLVK